MVAIILVSHSRKITDGLKEMIEEMTGRYDHIHIISAGGTDDGRLGTDPIFIKDQIDAHKNADSIFLFADIGSAVMSIETALELIEEDDLRSKCVYIDGPLVEGAFVGAVQCMVNPSREAVIREVTKLKSDRE
jgi:phosphoenolpyruvate---glycerone phosphotransferase subunit DhaM